METAVTEQAGRPSYLAQVEQLVGVRFFADAQLHAIAHSSPEALSPEIRATYAETYFAGLRLLVAARRAHNRLPYELTPPERRQIRTEHSEEIGEIQEQLLLATDVCAPPAVKAKIPQTARKELHLSDRIFNGVLADQEPVLIPYKRYPNSPTGSLYLSAESIDRIRAATETGVADEVDVTAGMKSAGQIAALTDTDIGAVRAQIAWHGWHEHYARLRHRDERGVKGSAFYLPDELADVIIAELSAIVPDEYLTVGEYAALRGTQPKTVRRVIEREQLPTHPFEIRVKSIAYLDGATMHTLDGLINRKQGQRPSPRPPAPKREIIVLPLTPENITGRTSLTALVEQTGIDRRSLRKSVPTKITGLENRPENFYDDADLARVLPKLPKREVPTKPPLSMTSLRSVLDQLPGNRRPTPKAAVKFILTNGGEVHDFAGYGNYVLGVSAGLIKYNFGWPDASPQKIGKGWLNREQLATATEQPQEVIDADLRELDWHDLQAKLTAIRNVRIGKSSPLTRSKVHVLWAKSEGGRIVLPHYNPTIVAHVQTMAKERRATARVAATAEAAAAIALEACSQEQ